jgi:ornithine carrier protein
VCAAALSPPLSCLCAPPGRLIDFPFDTIKTRLQTATIGSLQARLAERAGSAAAAAGASAASAAQALEGPLQCLKNTLAKEGFRGLYRGCLTPCMGAALEDSISFSVYHAVGRQVVTPGVVAPGQTLRPSDLTLSQVFLAGSCAGMSTSFLLTPLELIKCRMQIDRVSMVEAAGSSSSSSASTASSSSAAAAAAAAPAGPRYSGPWDCFVKSVRSEGVAVLYRGHTGTFLREGLGTGCWFATYEYFVRALAPGVDRDHLPAPVVLASGAVAGMMLNVIPYPLDTAKSVLQTLQLPAGSSKPLGIVDAMKLIVEVEGVAGLYRGISPALIRAVPANAAVFMAYETLSKALRNY